MKPIDILLILITICGTILVTYTYLQASPPYLVLSKEYGTVEIVGVSGDKCTINITGEIKNEGDVNAIKSKITCNVMTAGSNKQIGIGAADFGEVAPNRIKEFSMNAYLFECPLSGVDILCDVVCENCPK